MVVMCTPGMLQSGQSRTLLERWCHDPRNGVIITGYCAEGSIANNLKKGDSINSMEGNKPISVNLNVSEISFAAHADCQQTT
jgi:cleavage and polyadenylation specificity factor subunit 3